jgi:butyrate kinase
MFRTLLINPGSTSSEISLFEDETEIKTARIVHPVADLRRYKTILDQYPYRYEIIQNKLQEWAIQKGDLAAVVGRSAIGKKESGTYEVTTKMIEDIKFIMSHIEHPAGLGCMLAKAVADEFGVPAFVAHSVPSTFDRLAKVSGIPLIERRAVYHVQNIEGVAALAAREMNQTIDGVNLIIAHLEGGMSIAALCGGKLMDVSSAFEEGPFTTERSGALPVVSLVELCFSGKYTREDIQKMIRGEGGMVAYLGTNKIGEIEERVNRGDEEAAFYLEAMCYQIAKEIAAMASVLKGKVDAVILTGKILESLRAVQWIAERVSFIAPLKCYPEQEAIAYAEAALKVLRGQQQAIVYE